ALLLLYSVPFLLEGDFSPQTNFAIRVDKALLGFFMDGAYWDSPVSWKFSDSYDYAWIWSSLTFTVTVMMGCFAGKLIKDQKDTKPIGVALTLMWIGLACLTAGYLLGLY